MGRGRSKRRKEKKREVRVVDRMLRGKSERVKRETGQSRAKKFLVLSSPSIFFRPFSSLFPHFSLPVSATRMLLCYYESVERWRREERRRRRGEEGEKRNRRREREMKREWPCSLVIPCESVYGFRRR